MTLHRRLAYLPVALHAWHHNSSLPYNRIRREAARKGSRERKNLKKNACGASRGSTLELDEGEGLARRADGVFALQGRGHEALDGG